MILKRMLGHRSTLVFALTGGSESSSGCQNVSIGATMPTLTGEYAYAEGLD